MNDVSLLSFEQLERLAAGCRTLGAPIVGELRPGLEDSQIDDLMSPLGIDLPLEARTLWRWHDGTEGGSEVPAALREFGPEYAFLTLAQAVDLCRTRREVATEVNPEDPAEFWNPDWFPITKYGNIACDCSVPIGAPTPIRNIDYHHTGDWSKIRARSLGEMVGWWIGALDSGAWTYDSSRSHWLRNFDRIPKELAQTGLV